MSRWPRSRSSADKPLFGTRRSRPNFCDRLALGRRQAHNFPVEVSAAFLGVFFGKDLPEQPLGDVEGPATCFEPLGLTPGFEGHDRPGGASSQPEQRLHPMSSVIRSTDGGSRIRVHHQRGSLRRGHYTYRPTRRQDQPDGEDFFETVPSALKNDLSTS